MVSGYENLQAPETGPALNSFLIIFSILCILLTGHTAQTIMKKKKMPVSNSLAPGSHLRIPAPPFNTNCPTVTQLSFPLSTLSSVFQRPDRRESAGSCFL